MKRLSTLSLSWQFFHLMYSGSVPNTFQTHLPQTSEIPLSFKNVQKWHIFNPLKVLLISDKDMDAYYVSSALHFTIVFWGSFPFTRENLNEWPISKFVSCSPYHKKPISFQVALFLIWESKAAVFFLWFAEIREIQWWR